MDVSWPLPAEPLRSGGVQAQGRPAGQRAPGNAAGWAPAHRPRGTERSPPARRRRSSDAAGREESEGDSEPDDDGPAGDACTLAELQSVYHLPSKDAARMLNISLSRLKRSCREHNVLRWPHRKLSSLHNLQDTIRNDKNMKAPDKQRISEQITSEIAAVIANPEHTIDTRLDEIRQAKYKLKYYHKTKHIHAAAAAAARKRRHSAMDPSAASGGGSGGTGTATSPPASRAFGGSVSHPGPGAAAAMQQLLAAGPGPHGLARSASNGSGSPTTSLVTAAAAASSLVTTATGVTAAAAAVAGPAAGWPGPVTGDGGAAVAASAFAAHARALDGRHAAGPMATPQAAAAASRMATDRPSRSNSLVGPLPASVVSGAGPFAFATAPGGDAAAVACNGSARALGARSLSGVLAFAPPPPPPQSLSQRQLSGGLPPPPLLQLHAQPLHLAAAAEHERPGRGGEPQTARQAAPVPALQLPADYARRPSYGVMDETNPGVPQHHQQQQQQQQQYNQQQNHTQHYADAGNAAAAAGWADRSSSGAYPAGSFGSLWHEQHPPPQELQEQQQLAHRAHQLLPAQQQQQQLPLPPLPLYRTLAQEPSQQEQPHPHAQQLLLAPQHHTRGDPGPGGVAAWGAGFAAAAAGPGGATAGSALASLSHGVVDTSLPQPRCSSTGNNWPASGGASASGSADLSRQASAPTMLALPRHSYPGAGPLADAEVLLGGRQRLLSADGALALMSPAASAAPAHAPTASAAAAAAAGMRPRLSAPLPSPFGTAAVAAAAAPPRVSGTNMHGVGGVGLQRGTLWSPSGEATNAELSEATATAASIDAMLARGSAMGGGGGYSSLGSDSSGAMLRGGGRPAPSLLPAQMGPAARHSVLDPQHDPLLLLRQHNEVQQEMLLRRQRLFVAQRAQGAHPAEQQLRAELRSMQHQQQQQQQIARAVYSQQQQQQQQGLHPHQALQLQQQQEMQRQQAVQQLLRQEREQQLHMQQLQHMRHMQHANHEALRFRASDPGLGAPAALLGPARFTSEPQQPHMRPQQLQQATWSGQAALQQGPHSPPRSASLGLHPSGATGSGAHAGGSGGATDCAPRPFEYAGHVAPPHAHGAPAHVPYAAAAQHPGACGGGQPGRYPPSAFAHPHVEQPAYEQAAARVASGAPAGGSAGAEAAAPRQPPLGDGDIAQGGGQFAPTAGAGAGAAEAAAGDACGDAAAAAAAANPAAATEKVSGGGPAPAGAGAGAAPDERVKEVSGGAADQLSAVDRTAGSIYWLFDGLM